MSAANPAVSILLPTHNRCDTLALAIRSALEQSFGDFELLVVGDGCSDGSASVVRSFGDGRVRWFDLPKAAGFGYANRNVALAQARAPIVAYLAHDDLWFPDHLARMLPLFDEPSIRIAYSRPLWVMTGGEIVPGLFNLRDPNTQRRFVEKRFTALPAVSVVYRDEPGQRSFLWDDKLERQGDWDLWARVLTASDAPGIAYLGTPTTLHFKADWRREDEIGPAVLNDWAELHALSGVLSDAMRVKPRPGELQQATFAAALSANGGRRVAELRSAIIEAIDIFATSGGERKAPLVAALAKAEARANRLREEVDRKTTRIERLLEKIDSLKSTAKRRI